VIPHDLERVAAALDLRRRGSPDSIEKELREERASALTRAATRLRDALRRLEAAAGSGSTGGPTSPGSSGEASATGPVEDPERLQQQAADAAFALIVQREALGLHDGEALLDFHAVPRSVRARLGRWTR
jgi:hypothetical protein